MRLPEKVAIITGAGNGIGKAIALKFAKEGARVVIVDINAQKAKEVMDTISVSDGCAIAVHADISKKTDVDLILAKTIERYKTVDILVNSAGILQTKPIEQIKEEEWNKVFEINMKGTFLCCQAVLPVMKEKRVGRIINIASNAGRDGGVSTGLAYVASKAAVIGFSRGLARRVAEYGITCNTIAPGTTRSDMIKGFDKQIIIDVTESIPLKRLGDPEDIAELACLIASHHGSFMTGATIDINGGLFIG